MLFVCFQFHFLLFQQEQNSRKTVARVKMTTCAIQTTGDVHIHAFLWVKSVVVEQNVFKFQFSGDETFCSCPSGFVLDKDWRTCVDIDECLYEKYCEHQCVNSIGSYECMNTINEHQSDQHQKTSAECSDGFFDKATGECFGYF